MRSPNRMSPERDFEKRLESLREQAAANGSVSGRGVDIAGGPVPRKPGYYGEAVVRPPVWTWEIPLYFFIGGAGGMAPVLACAGLIFGHADLVRGAMCIAAIAAIVSPILLVMDLGRPRLFLNMLRVFKHQSPMSVGAWILSIFGTFAVPGWVLAEIHARQIFGGTLDSVIGVAAMLLIALSALFGLGLATYTGVLLGATAIPAWFLHRVLLPIHFGTAGLGSAAALLELFGFHLRPLYVLGLLAAGIETAVFLWLEMDKHGAADRALHEGRSGWMIRSGEILSGPLALLCRAFGFVPVAAISFLAGAFISRFAWLSAGRASGSDPEAVFASQR